jgi:hypothetical protein
MQGILCLDWFLKDPLPNQYVHNMAVWLVFQIGLHVCQQATSSKLQNYTVHLCTIFKSTLPCPRSQVAISAFCFLTILAVLHPAGCLQTSLPSQIK